MLFFTTSCCSWAWQRLCCVLFHLTSAASRTLLLSPIAAACEPWVSSPWPAAVAALGTSASGHPEQARDHHSSLRSMLCCNFSFFWKGRSASHFKSWLWQLPGNPHLSRWWEEVDEIFDLCSGKCYLWLSA